LPAPPPGQRVAVIGGGIAGLTAGHLLARRHTVTLFERAERLGGNAYTHRFSDGVEADIAVAVFGRSGYPRFFRLLGELGIRTQWGGGSYLSFHDLDTKTGTYLTPRGLRLTDVRSLWRLYRGVQAGTAIQAAGGFGELTFEQGLAQIPALTGPARIFLICVLCLMSSMSAEDVLAAPASFFFEKLRVHSDVISPRALYSVCPIPGKTRSYVEALAASVPRVVTGADVVKVVRAERDVLLVLADGRRETFDQVVLACNADQALAILDEPSDEERRLLGAWRYNPGALVVHRDLSSFPPRKLLQAYTFLYRLQGGRLSTSVNGSLWHEPGVPRDSDLVSSQHPNFPIDPARIELQAVLRTPIFDAASVATIPALPRLNGQRRSYFCGSHFGFGLHEDAVSSAVDVAALLGVEGAGS
jgi:uncharacterized protein